MTPRAAVVPGVQPQVESLYLFGARDQIAQTKPLFHAFPDGAAFAIS
jgi:hypothetical protein